MPLFTAAARALGDDRQSEVIQMVVAAYHSDHAVDLLNEAVNRHNHPARCRDSLPFFVLVEDSVIKRPKRCVLTPVRARFANLFTGNYYGADSSARLYRNAPCGGKFVERLNL